MAKNQTVVAAYNKAHFVGFNFTTSDSVSTDVFTAADLAAYGGQIREIALLPTLAAGYLGFGIAASVPAANSAVEYIVPIFKDAYVTLSGVNVDSLTVRRAAATDIKIEGYIVVR